MNELTLAAMSESSVLKTNSAFCETGGAVAIDLSRWFESYLNPHATSGDYTSAKSLLKHLSTSFVSAKT